MFRRVRALLIGYVVIAIVCGWPIASVLIAGTIASWNDCTLHEGFSNPCLVNGTDIGPQLYQMGVMGWFMLATIPMGVIAFIAWTIGWVVWTNLNRRKVDARV